MPPFSTAPVEDSSPDQQEDASMPQIDDHTTAFSHVPEHGFSLFLAKRSKTIHFVRHAEGKHNAANQAAGDDSPVTFSTAGSWDYIDAKLTERGIQQCLTLRSTVLHDVKPQLVVVSPFTRTLQTAHIMFGGGSGVPFLVHDLARERSGKYTCDKRRTREDIVREFEPVFSYTNDSIDFDGFGFPDEQDTVWTDEREPAEVVTARGIAFMQWLASRPETDIAVVTHSSWLKLLFRAFGEHIAHPDQAKLHRLVGNAELRSVCLALHRGFYPEGTWVDDEFVPHDHSFRRGRWAPSHENIAHLHGVLSGVKKHTLKDQASMPI